MEGSWVFGICFCSRDSPFLWPSLTVMSQLRRSLPCWVRALVYHVSVQPWAPVHPGSQEVQVSVGAGGSCVRLSSEGEEEMSLGPRAWCLIASVMSLVCKTTDATGCWVCVCVCVCKLVGTEGTERCPNPHRGSAAETGLKQKSP